MKKLEQLELGDNQLRCSFPQWVADFPRLLHLNLGQNDISGDIPEAMGMNLINLRQFLWVNRQTTRFDKIYRYYDALLGLFNDHIPHRRDLIWIHSNLPLEHVPLIQPLIVAYISTESARLSDRFSPAAAA